MERFEVGMLAISKAGRDNDTLYVIMRTEKEYVYLVNGKNHTFDNPKRKNKKHVQIIKHIDLVLQKKLVENNKIQNEDVKRTIKLYRLKED